MKVQYRLMALVALCATGLAGCGGQTASTPSTPASGGTAVIALPVQTSPNWFFPLVSLTADSVVNYQVDELMYKPLLHFSANDEVNYHRSLASSVTWNRTGTRYTVTLHRKWHWSNGHPVTAHDVVFTYQLMKAASSGAAHLPWGFSGAGSGGMPTLWKNVQATGTHTVVITLTKPMNQEWFLHNGINQIIPVPQSVWDKHPHNMIQELQFIDSVSNSPNAAPYGVSVVMERKTSLSDPVYG